MAPARPHPWNPLPPLLLGFCFGLSFAVTFRLLDGRFASLVRLGERFEVKGTPGVGLESLRMRYGLPRVDLHAPPPEPPAATIPPEAEVPPVAAPTAEPPLAEPLRHSFTDTPETAVPPSEDGRGAVVPGPLPTFTGGPALPEAPPLTSGSATVVPPPANRR